MKFVLARHLYVLQFLMLNATTTIMFADLNFIVRTMQKKLVNVGKIGGRARETID